MANAVALKLPEFWEQNVSAWFVQAEAQFAIRDITSEDTKYYYVVASLKGSTAARVINLIENPPARDKYTTLKGHLKGVFGLSEPERARQLLSLPGLGDSKPSELMDHMLALLGDHQPCFLFKELFLQQLPDQIRLPLTSSVKVDLRELAKEADVFFSAGRKTFSVTPLTNTSTACEECMHQPHTHSVSASAVARREKSSLCFYHGKFGNKAKKCLPPCSWSGNALAATR